MTQSSSAAENVHVQQVNLAVVLDGSGTISTLKFSEAKDFAKNIAAVFAARNMFANGGTASYVQFSSDVDPSDTGTFFSLSEFNDFVDSNDQIYAGTDIDAGIIAAQHLLNDAPPASAAFMVVLTDGEDNVGGDNVAVTADDARDDGITMLAVGVGECPFSRANNTTAMYHSSSTYVNTVVHRKKSFASSFTDTILSRPTRTDLRRFLQGKEGNIYCKKKESVQT